jgi:hypothetical protein
MASPFPGMDPWLEWPGVFPDFHNAFLTYLREALNTVLPPPFFAAIATRIYMEESERQVEPDVDVLRPIDYVPRSTNGANTSTIAVRDLLEVPKNPLPDEEITEIYLEVRTGRGQEELITSIEMLSLSNETWGKTGRGLYLAKQFEMISAGVNLVEIDLLRRGTHATAVSLGELRRRAGRFDYHVCVTSREKQSVSFVAPILLSEPLPVIPIPLTEDLPPVQANFQDVLSRTYDAALYARRLRYDEPCDPPLTAEQQAWAENILRAKGIVK